MTDTIELPTAPSLEQLPTHEENIAFLKECADAGETGIEHFNAWHETYREKFPDTPLNLEMANLEDVNLEDAILEDAILRWADLQGADLERANLEGADLREARGDKCTLVTLGQLQGVLNPFHFINTLAEN